MVGGDGDVMRIPSLQSPHGCTGPTFKWDIFNTFIIQDKTSKSGNSGVDRNDSSLFLNDAIKIYNTPVWQCRHFLSLGF